MAKEVHRLQESILQVSYFDDQEDKAETDQLDDTLEVSNFPTDVSEYVVELYFENPKSGGCDGGVKSVTIIGPGVAQVQFSSATSEYVVVVFITFLPTLRENVHAMEKYAKCQECYCILLNCCSAKWASCLNLRHQQV